MQNRLPKTVLQEWIPHFLFMGILLFVGYFIYHIFIPITGPLILAASLCTLTYPLLYEPFDRILKQKFPRFSKMAARQYLAVFSTFLLILIALSPCLVLIYSETGSITEMSKDIMALLMGDAQTAIKLENHINRQLTILQNYIPNIPLKDLKIVKELMEFIQSIHKFAPSFMTFLFKGTGSILLQFVLTLIGICFFYAHGPNITSKVLSKTSLNEVDINQLYHIHRRVILRILNDTLATSLCKGTLMAIVISSFIDFPFWLIFFAATLISLLPLIGGTIVWLPMASLLWSQGHPAKAISLAVLCIITNFGVDFLRKRFGQKIYASSHIVNFFIFMSMIGGIFSFGVKGLIIGPICVIYAVVLGTFWFSLYDTQPESNQHA